MSLRRKVLQGSGLMMGGQMLGLGMSFIRNIIVARLISTDDFGIASTFFISISLFEMISNLSVDRLLVQAEVHRRRPGVSGDGAGVSGAARRGKLAAHVPAGLAVLASVRHSPGVVGVSVRRPLCTIDSRVRAPGSKRLHREYAVRSGRPLRTAASDCRACAGMAPCQMVRQLRRDALAAGGASRRDGHCSQVTSVRRYAWAWNRSFFSRMAKFGWPLLLNGVLMFLIWQGIGCLSEAPTT